MLQFAFVIVFALLITFSLIRRPSDANSNLAWCERRSYERRIRDLSALNNNCRDEHLALQQHVQELQEEHDLIRRAVNASPEALSIFYKMTAARRDVDSLIQSTNKDG